MPSSGASLPLPPNESVSSLSPVVVQIQLCGIPITLSSSVVCLSSYVKQARFFRLVVLEQWSPSAHTHPDSTAGNDHTNSHKSKGTGPAANVASAVMQQPPPLPVECTTWSVCAPEEEGGEGAAHTSSCIASTAAPPHTVRKKGVTEASSSSTITSLPSRGLRYTVEEGKCYWIVRQTEIRRRQRLLSVASGSQTHSNTRMARQNTRPGDPSSSHLGCKRFRSVRSPACAASQLLEECGLLPRAHSLLSKEEEEEVVVRPSTAPEDGGVARAVGHPRSLARCPISTYGSSRRRSSGGSTSLCRRSVGEVTSHRVQGISSQWRRARVTCHISDAGDDDEEALTHLGDGCPDLANALEAGVEEGEKEHWVPRVSTSSVTSAARQSDGSLVWVCRKSRNDRHSCGSARTSGRRSATKGSATESFPTNNPLVIEPSLVECSPPPSPSCCGVASIPSTGVTTTPRRSGRRSQFRCSYSFCGAAGDGTDGRVSTTARLSGFSMSSLDISLPQTPSTLSCRLPHRVLAEDFSAVSSFVP